MKVQTKSIARKLAVKQWLNDKLCLAIQKRDSSEILKQFDKSLKIFSV